MVFPKLTCKESKDTDCTEGAPNFPALTSLHKQSTPWPGVDVKVLQCARNIWSANLGHLGKLLI